MRILPDLPHSCAEAMWPKHPGELGAVAHCTCRRIFEHRELTWWRSMLMRLNGSVPAQFAGVWTCVGREVRESQGGAS